MNLNKKLVIISSVVIGLFSLSAAAQPENFSQKYTFGVTVKPSTCKLVSGGNKAFDMGEYLQSIVANTGNNITPTPISGGENISMPWIDLAFSGCPAKTTFKPVLVGGGNPDNAISDQATVFKNTNASSTAAQGVGITVGIMQHPADNNGTLDVTTPWKIGVPLEKGVTSDDKGEMKIKMRAYIRRFTALGEVKPGDFTSYFEMNIPYP